MSRLFASGVGVILLSLNESKPAGRAELHGPSRREVKLDAEPAHAAFEPVAAVVDAEAGDGFHEADAIIVLTRGICMRQALSRRTWLTSDSAASAKNQCAAPTGPLTGRQNQTNKIIATITAPMVRKQSP